MYRIIFILILILAIALGLLLGTLNSDPVSVDLLWVQISWPLGLVILSAVSSGLLLGLGLAWFFGILPLKIQLRNSRKGNPETS